VPQGKILGDKVFGGQASGTSLVSVQTGWRRWSKPCPLVVLGGAGLVMFGMVAATGARILTAVDFKNNHHNLFVAAQLLQELAARPAPVDGVRYPAQRDRRGRVECLLQRDRQQDGPPKLTRGRPRHQRRLSGTPHPEEPRIAWRLEG
jgi:hypothetical protein